jgi:hypothetical protein
MDRHCVVGSSFVPLRDGALLLVGGEDETQEILPHQSSFPCAIFLVKYCSQSQNHFNLVSITALLQQTQTSAISWKLAHCTASAVLFNSSSFNLKIIKRIHESAWSRLCPLWLVCSGCTCSPQRLQNSCVEPTFVVVAGKTTQSRS